MHTMHPEHFEHVAGPVYVDPLHEWPEDWEMEPLEPAWVMEVVDGLGVLAADLGRWCALGEEEDLISLRLSRGPSIVDESALSHPSLPAAALPGLASFVRRVTEHNSLGEPVWRDEEHHLGDAIATALAERSRDFIVPYIRFLESNDLDHEVEQAHHIARVLAAHGWCPETLALWVARKGTCAGQAGSHTDFGALVPESVEEHLAAHPARRDLLIELIAGNMAALVPDDRGDRERTEHGFQRMLRVYWQDLPELGTLAASIVARATDRAREHLRDGTDAARPWLDRLAALESG